MPAAEKARLDALIAQVDVQLATVLAETDPTLSYSIGGRSLSKAEAVRELVNTRKEFVAMRDDADVDEAVTFADLDGEATTGDDE